METPARSDPDNHLSDITRETLEEPQVEYASFNTRFLASMIDTTLIGLCLTPLFDLFAPDFRSKYGIDDFLRKLQAQVASPGILPDELVITLQDFFITQGFLRIWLLNSLAQFVVLGVIFFLFWRKYEGTPGKMLLRIRIVDEYTLEAPSPTQCVVRYLGYIVSMLPLMLGFFAISWNRKRQAWHDKMASTIVIKIRKKSA